MGKVDDMQEPTGTISTEMETQRKNRQKKLEFRNTGTEMKPTCEGALNNSTLGTAKESTHDFKHMSTEAFKTEVQREKRRKKNIHYPGTVRQSPKVSHVCNEDQKEERERNRGNSWSSETNERGWALRERQGGSTSPSPSRTTDGGDPVGQVPAVTPCNL